MSSRCCAKCDRKLSKSCFSSSQWSKGSGISRCNACARRGSSSSTQKGHVLDASKTARCNNSTSARFEKHALEHPFAQGAFRWVAKGTYTAGSRRGEPCVCKWFKTGGVMESEFYKNDLKASNAAIRLITKWNAKQFINRMVQVNSPEVWTFYSGKWKGRKVLQEPFISNYQKFNSNSGWADDSIPWARVMQALSHFTFHASNGEAVLCDLQGGVYKNGVVLTDPVVMSKSGRYGPTDLGSRGISSFFSSHVCNEYCCEHWRLPKDVTRYHRCKVGTTMVRHVPTRHTRPNMTMSAR